MSFEDNPADEVTLSGSDFAQMCDEIKNLKEQLAKAEGRCKWQPIETAPMGDSLEPETHFIGMKIDRKSLNVHTCYRNENGAYESWGGGMQPDYWMPWPEITSDTAGSEGRGGDHA